MVTHCEAHESAAQALRVVSVKAILYLRSVAQNGGLNGRHYDSCFYGTLATGSGHFVGQGPTQFKNVQEFCWDVLGVKLRYGRLSKPIEDFCNRICSSETADSNSLLQYISDWCDEELARRDVESWKDSSEKTDLELLDSIDVEFANS